MANSTLTGIPTEMIIVQSTFSLLSEGIEEALTLMEHMETLSRKEPGCLSYQYFQSISEPSKVVLLQEWKTAENLQDHYQTEHMEKFITKLSSCLSAQIVSRSYASREESSASSFAAADMPPPERTMH